MIRLSSREITLESCSRHAHRIVLNAPRLKPVENGDCESPIVKNSAPSQTFKVTIVIEPSFLMPSIKVLSLGVDPELLWLREAVLRSAGFEVMTSLDLKHGLSWIERGDCGVLLLCYSLPLSSRRQLAGTFRANCPRGRIVTIMNQKGEPEFADVVVYGVDGPEALIEAIRAA